MMLSLALTAATACSAAGKPPAPSEVPPIRVAVSPAHAERLPIVYTASGTVRGRNTAVLASKTIGYVRTMLVQPGDAVGTGQLLAELEANDLRASVARSRAGLARAVQGRFEAQSALSAAQSAAKVAQATHDRTKQLLADRAIPQQAYDDDEAAWRGAVAQEEIAQARLQAVTSGIDEARAGLAESQATLEYSRIVAPFSGHVIERRVDAGALAAPGTPLLVVADDSLLRVEAPLEESRAAQLEVGDSATVEADTLAAPMVGRVSEIVPSVDVASRAFLAKVDLPDGARLRPGAFVRVRFRIGTRSRLVVPQSSLRALGSLERVLVVQGDTVRLRMVTLGEAHPPWIEVLSGLSPGESIVTLGPAELRDGSRVEVAR